MTNGTGSSRIAKGYFIVKCLKIKCMTKNVFYEKNDKNKMKKEFIPQRGNYQNLKVYQLGNCIYALTYAFAHRYLEKGDRTIDQMIQAARSGKQNIAEGSVDGSTSAEIEIKLTNVAKGSMHELRIDYEDFLLTRGLEKWGVNDPRTRQVRKYCKTHMDPEDYRRAVETRSAETIANIAITMLHQFDVMITGLIEAQKRRFLQEGGVREKMYKARVEKRGEHNNRSTQRAKSSPSNRK